MVRWRMTFILITISAWLFVVMFLLTRCSGNPDMSGKTVVKFWQFIASPEYLTPILQQFEAENPDIKVEMQQLTYDNGFEKIVTSIAAGTAPDLCEIGSTWLARFAYEGAIRDLSENVSDIQDSLLMWEMVKYQEKYFGIPWILGTRALFYNKTLLEKAGLDSSKPPQTWDELYDYAQRIHQPDQGVYGFGLVAGEPYAPWQKFLPILWAHHGNVINDDWRRCLLTEPSAIAAMDHYKSLKKVSLIDRQGQIDQLFNQGNMAFNLSGSWNLALIPRNNPGLNYGVSLLPRLSGNSQVPMSIAGGELLIVMQKSKVSEAALRLAKFLVKLENIMPIVIKQKNVIPAAKNGINHSYYSEHPKEKIFYQQLLQSRPMPVHPAWIEIQEQLTRAIEKVLINDENSKVVLQEATQRMNIILKRFKFNG